jgi:hypothetical protein
MVLYALKITVKLAYNNLPILVDNDEINRVRFTLCSMARFSKFALQTLDIPKSRIVLSSHGLNELP